MQTNFLKLCLSGALFFIATNSLALDYCRRVSSNKEGFGPIIVVGNFPLRLVKPNTPGRCIATRTCRDSKNHEGFGRPFWNEGKLYRKFDEDWSQKDETNWCLVKGTDPSPDINLIEHRGQHLFVTGANLGNVQFIPFRNSPYAQSEQEMKNLLRKAFQDLSASGTNTYRFWLHIDGNRSPSFDLNKRPQDALTTGLPEGVIEDLKWVIRTAYQDYGLLINITLWSHDILAVRRDNPVESRDRAVHMVTDDLATQAYIDKALTPLVKSMAEKLPNSDRSYRDAILSWEVFNEPEGTSSYWRLYWNYQYAMQYGDYSWRRSSLKYLDNRERTEFAIDKGTDEWNPIQYKGWYFIGTLTPEFNSYMYKDVTDDYPSEWDFLKKAIIDDKSLKTVDIPADKILRFINKVAGAIHRMDPEAKVSSGAHSIPYNTQIEIPGLGYKHAPYNYYSDDSLVLAGGDLLGTLDFYQVHGYPDWSEPKKDALINMFKHPKAHWNLDKPLVIGEHWTIIDAQNEMLKPYHYQHLHDTGYAGAWTWAYFYVKEKTDEFGKPIRYIDKHENQDFFRQFFQDLPSELKVKFQ